MHLTTLIKKISYTLVSVALSASVLANTPDNVDVNPYDNSYQAQPNTSNVNMYIGANIGFLKVATIDSALNSLQSKFPLTYSAYLGYIVSNHLALEAGYGYSTIDSNDQATFNFPYLAARLTLPLGSKVDLYTKLGGSYVGVTSKTQPDANTHGFIPYLGLGADFNILPNVALNIDAAGPSIGVVGLYAISGGIIFKF